MALPGLINTHTHSGMSLLRGYADDMELMTWLKEKIWPMEAGMNSKDIKYGSKLAIMEMLKNGITTFNDMYFSMEEVAEVVDKSGIRAQLGYGLIEDKDGSQGLEYTRNYIESYHNSCGGRITCNIAPHAPYTCSKKYLQKIVKLAEEYNVNIHTHVAETAREVENLIDKEGISPVKYLNRIGIFDQSVIAVHCVHVDNNDIEILADKNISVSHNPSSNAKLASGISPISEMLKADINVSLGTDSAASNNNLDLISEARLASYLQKVNTNNATELDISQIMKMITENAAKTLGLEKLGRLEQGYKADLILVNKEEVPEFYPDYNSLSNLFYASNGSQVEYVFVDGQEIVKESEIKTMSEIDIYKEVSERAKKLNS